MHAALKALRWLLLCAAALLTAAPLQAAAVRPAAAPRLQRGTELVALRPVRLREAALRQGSRVIVVAVARRSGQPVAVDLELKDGHVLRKVAYATVQMNFRAARR